MLQKNDAYSKFGKPYVLLNENLAIIQDKTLLLSNYFDVLKLCNGMCRAGPK